ncbi:MAG: hypothetical protein A3G29_01030 [Burkholderiales bacterium RIFCSPLOWO2_12_FULL_64_99]|nr:MAG: hypothetical protein A3E52_03385 [Burkholderiales bacterium RIFCSPHIGHO2_12_FULL_63_20]OGB60506.1 MAG: hypothetical protein A3G29_01030 [Burkholderiales bacterium RIFCSPLOWO2_12_FULL_64_99]
MSGMIAVRLGEQAKTLAERYPSKLKYSAQPAGLDFLGAKWTGQSLGAIEIQHGQVSLHLDRVLTMDATQDASSFNDEGVTEIDVNMQLTDQDLIGHDEARQGFLGFLQALKQGGWMSTIERGMPRISGRDRFMHVLDHSSAMGLDAEYTPTLTEWMRIESQTPWGFWRDGAYLEVSFMREHTLLDPVKPGAYVVTLRVRTAREEARSLVEPENRDRWQEHLPEVLKQLDWAREKKEQELGARGITIQKDYRDPPLVN